VVFFIFGGSFSGGDYSFLGGGIGKNFEGFAGFLRKGGVLGDEVFEVVGAGFWGWGVSEGTRKAAWAEHEVFSTPEAVISDAPSPQRRIRESSRVVITAFSTDFLIQHVGFSWVKRCSAL